MVITIADNRQNMYNTTLCTHHYTPLYSVQAIWVVGRIWYYVLIPLSILVLYLLVPNLQRELTVFSPLPTLKKLAKQDIHVSDFLKLLLKKFKK
jgi:hypothetical protein